MIGAGGYSIELSPGSRVLSLEKSISGHLLLPITEWNKLPTKADKSFQRVSFFTEEPTLGQQFKADDKHAYASAVRAGTRQPFPGDDESSRHVDL